MRTIEIDGWALISAEERNAEHPTTFVIPDRHAREGLRPGDAAKLLFDIETKENNEVVDRGVDRMWVIVTRCGDGLYHGVLESDPGAADGLDLRPGTLVTFGPEHIADIDRPPRDYLIERFGTDFRDEKLA